ncbi:hypothetical protein ACFXTN_014736 [Malus domestica]
MGDFVLAYQRILYLDHHRAFLLEFLHINSILYLDRYRTFLLEFLHTNDILIFYRRHRNIVNWVFTKQKVDEALAYQWLEHGIAPWDFHQWLELAPGDVELPCLKEQPCP